MCHQRSHGLPFLKIHNSSVTFDLIHWRNHKNPLINWRTPVYCEEIKAVTEDGLCINPPASTYPDVPLQKMIPTETCHGPRFIKITSSASNYMHNKHDTGVATSEYHSDNYFSQIKPTGPHITHWKLCYKVSVPLPDWHFICCDNFLWGGFEHFLDKYHFFWNVTG